MRIFVSILFVREYCHRINIIIIIIKNNRSNTGIKQQKRPSTPINRVITMTTIEFRLSFPFVLWFRIRLYVSIDVICNIVTLSFLWLHLNIRTKQRNSFWQDRKEMGKKFCFFLLLLFSHCCHAMVILNSFLFWHWHFVSNYFFFSLFVFHSKWISILFIIAFGALHFLYFSYNEKQKKKKMKYIYCFVLSKKK